MSTKHIPEELAVQPEYAAQISSPHNSSSIKFSSNGSFMIFVRRIRAAEARSEPCLLTFDEDLLRFSLTVKANDNTPTQFNITSIKHYHVYEKAVKEAQQENNKPVTVKQDEKIVDMRYGESFTLSVLSLSGKSKDIDELVDLIERNDSNSSLFATSIRYDRWVRRAMYTTLDCLESSRIINKREFIMILTEFLNINKPDKFKDWFSKFSDHKKETMSMTGLTSFFKDLIFDWSLVNRVILDGTNCKHSLTVSQLKRFYKDVQKEDMSSEKRKSIFSKRVTGVKYSKKDSNIQLQDFYTLLFSRENDIQNRDKTDNMAYSLNSYWINSSHNTYLMGHQLQGSSSVEAYIRVLLSGCRCLELDCIDGSNEEPLVYHINTPVTRIKLVEVLKVINKFAFVTSEYPVILSIENHLCIEQQIIMANMFRSIFKNKLITHDLFPENSNLPSPDALMKKIIIKTKKISKTGPLSDEIIDEPDENDEELQDELYETLGDIKQNDKHVNKFSVYLNDSIDGHLYSYAQIAIQGSYLHVKEERDIQCYTPEMQHHRCNSWYFGAMSRETAEDTIRDFIQTRYTKLEIDQTEAIGSFLVRRSGKTLALMYSIVVTVWVGSDVKHVKIKSAMTLEGHLQFYLESSHKFKSLEELVAFYHVHGKTPQSIYFKFPIPNPAHYIDKLWYKRNLERAASEKLLLSPPVIPGKFLVRDRIVQTTQLGFTISFLSKNPDSTSPDNIIVQHLAAKKIGPYLKISDKLKFWSLNHMVEHFSEKGIQSGGDLKLNKICGDGRTVLRSSYKDNVMIELNESYPYEEGNVKLLLLEGLRFQNAVKISDGFKEYYKANLGLRKGIKLPEEIVTVIRDSSPFGDLMKTKIHIDKQNMLPTTNNDTVLFHFDTPISRITIKFGNHKDLEQFTNIFYEVHSNDTTSDVQNIGKKGISKELSDVAVYCQAAKVPKPFTKAKIELLDPYEMCSFSETTVEKLSKNREEYMNMSIFCRNQIARMYPSWKRFDSSNYHPLMPWAFGMQMVALNFQTPDLAMQLNNGMFSRNASRGYVLKPPFMRSDKYDPNNMATYVSESEPVVISISLLTGRLISLPKQWNRTGCYVTLTLYDVGEGQVIREKSSTDKSPGISPKWYEVGKERNNFEFNVSFPQLAMLQFSLFSSSNSNELIGQRCVPVDYIKEGYRSVILHNVWGEELELASLLVHATMSPSELHRTGGVSRQGNDLQRDIDLRMKATHLASELHCNVLHRDAPSNDHLAEQQETLEQYLSELFNLRYSDTFLDALENPLDTPTPFLRDMFY